MPRPFWVVLFGFTIFVTLSHFSLYQYRSATCLREVASSLTPYSAHQHITIYQIMQTGSNNRAACLIDKQVYPLIVSEAPYTAPCENEVVVKTSAVAINPIDTMNQAMGDNI